MPRGSRKGSKLQDTLNRQRTSTAGFIRAYGMFWLRDEVDWKGADSAPYKELLGRIGRNSPGFRMANFWDQRGIYILYNDYGPYYVGKTVGHDMNLGRRLSHHYFGTNGSPHKGKWNRFSWFGWRATLEGVDKRGLRKLRRMPARLLADSRTSVQDIESLLIHALGTIHVANGRRETFAAAMRWEQVLQSERDHFLDKLTSH